MIIASLVCALSILIDQLSKHLAFAMEADEVVITSFLILQKAHNKGAAFGFLGSIENSHLILIPLSAVTIFTLVILIRHNKKLSALVKIPLGMVLGGALSNLYDRIQFGYVKDFIHFHYQRFSWPIFNFADAFICVGVLMLFLTIIKHHPDKKTDTLLENNGPET